MRRREARLLWQMLPSPLVRRWVGVGGGQSLELLGGCRPVSQNERGGGSSPVVAGGCWLRCLPKHRRGAGGAACSSSAVARRRGSTECPCPFTSGRHSCAVAGGRRPPGRRQEGQSSCRGWLTVGRVDRWAMPCARSRTVVGKSAGTVWLRRDAPATSLAPGWSVAVCADASRQGGGGHTAG